MCKTGPKAEMCKLSHFTVGGLEESYENSLGRGGREMRNGLITV